MEIELWPHQIVAADGLRQGFREGHNAQLLVAPTAFGKTVTASYMINEAVKKGTDTYFMVDRIQLVNQASATLDRYGIDHGIYQSDHWRYRPYLKAQICSVQTLERSKVRLSKGLVIIDEAHSTREFVKKLIKSGEHKVVGLTASPFTKGLGNLYTNVVNPATTNDLIAQGFLTPIKAYACVEADMKGARVFGGEYAEKDVETRGSKIIGDIVREWIDRTNHHFGGPKKTIVFGGSVAHCEEIRLAFKNAGFDFAVISYMTEGEEREAIMKDFARPDSQYMGLISVDALAKGFDQTDIMVGICARPLRKSFLTHVQMIGRVMRIAPGTEKEEYGYALWLDHSGNYLRFRKDLEDLFQNGVKDLSVEDKDSVVRKEVDKKERIDIVCACGAIMPPFVKACPECGREKTRKSLIEVAPGKMVEVNGIADRPRKISGWLEDRDTVWKMLTAHANEFAATKGKDANSDYVNWYRCEKWKQWYGEQPPYSRTVFEELPPSRNLDARVLRDRIAHNKAKRAKNAIAKSR